MKPTNNVKKKSKKSKKSTVEGTSTVTVEGTSTVTEKEGTSTETEVIQPDKQEVLQIDEREQIISSFEVPPHMTDYWDLLDTEASKARRARIQEVKSARRWQNNKSDVFSFEGGITPKVQMSPAAARDRGDGGRELQIINLRAGIDINDNDPTALLPRS